MNGDQYSSIQCYDTVNKCAISQIGSTDLPSNPNFIKSCQGTPVKCCNLDLVNRLYIPVNPGKNQVPIHARRNSTGHWEICPSSAYTECAQESDFGLCAARKCNDLGYLEPDNYYQVCKTLNPMVPDCSGRTCDQVVNLIPTHKKEVESAPAAPICIPDSAFEERGFSIGNLFKMFPNDDGFFIKGTVIIGVIILVIMLINVFLGPREKNYFLNGSDLYSQYFRRFL